MPGYQAVRGEELVPRLLLAVLHHEIVGGTLYLGYQVGVGIEMKWAQLVKVCLGKAFDALGFEPATEIALK